jgi:hypothetical protein
LTGVNRSYSSPEVQGSFLSRLHSLSHLHRSFWGRGVTCKHFGSPQCHGCRSRHKSYHHRELCVSYKELTTVTIDKFSDNITYYKCDVSNLEEVEAVAKRVIEEVRYHPPPLTWSGPASVDRPSHRSSQQCWRCPREAYPGPLTRRC